MGTKIVESRVDSIASGKSFSLSTLHLQIGRGCQSDRSVCIGMDYNANINWIVAGLPDGRKVNVINSFYVKFERHGWSVEAVYIGNPMRHDEKYLLINQAFAGKQRAKGDNRKDKAGEKLAVSEEDLLEHRTDGTDAFDTIYIGAKKIPYREAFSISTSGIL